MREIILDHGSEFGAHRIHDDGSWNGDFKAHLEKYGLKPILVPLLAIFSTFLDACQKLLSYCLSASRIPGKLNWKGH